VTCLYLYFFVGSSFIIVFWFILLGRLLLLCLYLYNYEVILLLLYFLAPTVESMESHGSIVTHLLSQLRIGMDLTKVVLPTFILEKRSLLEMYSDFFAHPDLFVRSGGAAYRRFYLFIHLFIRIFIYSFIYILTYFFIYSFIDSQCLVFRLRIDPRCVVFESWTIGISSTIYTAQPTQQVLL